MRMGLRIVVVGIAGVGKSTVVQKSVDSIEGASLAVFGTGIGLLLMCDIILQYYQMLVKEQLEEFSPQLAGILGQT